jgi:hypothetical protein
MEDGKKYYRLLCRDYEIAAGELSVPDDASVSWGLGKAKLSTPEYSGDICPGITIVTPAAQPTFVKFPLASKVSVPVEKSGPNQRGNVTHGTLWGNGIVLRDDERKALREQLRVVFRTRGNELTPGLLAHLLRAFWPGRTYVRTFKFCGKKGKKLSEFHLKRIEAVYSKFPELLIMYSSEP